MYGCPCCWCLMLTAVQCVVKQANEMPLGRVKFLSTMQENFSRTMAFKSFKVKLISVQTKFPIARWTKIANNLMLALKIYMYVYVCINIYIYTLYIYIYTLYIYTLYIYIHYIYIHYIYMQKIIDFDPPWTDIFTSSESKSAWVGSWTFSMSWPLPKAYLSLASSSWMLSFPMTDRVMPLAE